MKIKTTELTGPALDWAVAKCEGIEVYVPAFAEKPWLQYRDCHGQPHMCPKYSTDWAQGGLIIECECMDILCLAGGDDGWQADRYLHSEKVEGFGPTALIAICRCYVASKLGDEVDVPEELLCPSPPTNSAL